MPKLILFAALLISFNASAAVEFRGGGWSYGTADLQTIKGVGIISNEMEPSQVTLTFTDNRQVILTGAHMSMGLSLIPMTGKCVKVIPGYMFRSVNILTTCAD